MKLTTTMFATGTAVLLALSSVVVADFNSHVGINVENGQLTTQNWVSGTGYLGESRVFAFPSVDGFDTLFDIGTNSVGGTFATPGQIGFNMLSQLSVWNGGGFSTVDSTLTVSFGPESFTSSTGFVEGYGTNVRDETSHPGNPAQWGRHHTHQDFVLNDDGTSALGDGVYMIEMELWYEAGGDNPVSYLNSESFFVLLSVNADGEVAAARSYLESALPAPGALALLGIAGLAGARRRRAS